MKLSVQENQIMTHLQSRFPKGSSIKQLSIATKRNRAELTTALQSLSALTLIGVTKKDEVALRVAGKEYLGLNKLSGSTSLSQPLGKKTLHQQADEKMTLAHKKTMSPPKATQPTVKLETSTTTKSVSELINNTVLQELDTLTAQLTKPLVTLKNKAEKVKLLIDLSERLQSRAPRISEHLLEIANVLHGLNEAN